MTEEKSKRVVVKKNLIYHRGGVNAVRWIRERRGITQEELAERSGVSQNSVSRIETGKRKPHKGTLQKLATALGVEDWTTLGVEVPEILPLEDIMEWDPERRRRLFDLYRETGFVDHVTKRLEGDYSEDRALYKDDEEHYVDSKLESAYMLGYAKGYHEGRRATGRADGT